MLLEQDRVGEFMSLRACCLKRKGSHCNHQERQQHAHTLLCTTIHISLGRGAYSRQSGLNPKQHYLYPQAAPCADFSNNTWRSKAQRHRLSILASN